MTRLLCSLVIYVCIDCCRSYQVYRYIAARLISPPGWGLNFSGDHGSRTQVVVIHSLQVTMKTNLVVDIGSSYY